MTNEQAIRHLEDLQRLYLGNEKFTADIEAIEIAIEALKRPNTYQKPTGRWERRFVDYNKCSICGEIVKYYHDYKYCPNCGARMSESEGDK